ncbi:MAG: hypothetical protein KF805_03605 [Phycisphaeraceae bacterium]|nr:hypothetical protein [Phycisphaeraceae bacterium]
MTCAFVVLDLDGGHGVGRINFRGMFWFGVTAVCVFPLGVFGAVVVDALMKRDRRAAAVCVVFSILYATCFVILPFLGRA